MSNSQSAIDLEDVLSRINNDPNVDNTVGDYTIIWIEAWGGNGGNGNVCCTYGKPGGIGGYAQTTTTLRAFSAAYGTTDIYYYLGVNGTFTHDSGGDGGTGTLLTVNDLTEEDMDLEDTLLMAGGGGGGGAGRGTPICNLGFGPQRIFGGHGGAGASAIALLNEPVTIIPGAIAQVNGSEGQGDQVDHGGAANTRSGGTAARGDDPTAPLGGRGGNHASPQTGFANAFGTVVAGGGGQGSDGGNGAGGGGAAAPTTRPDNPNGIEGFVQITFDLGAWARSKRHRSAVGRRHHPAHGSVSPIHFENINLRAAA